MLAELIALENGKALPDAAGEVAYAAEFFRWFAEEAVRLERRADDGAGGDEPDHRAAPADRGRGAGHAMEFPGGDGDAQARAGAGGGLHLRAEAGDGDAADRLR